MKSVTHYFCEICDNRYSTPQEALECEAQGISNKDYPPVGLLWTEDDDGFYGPRIAFAVAHTRNEGHYTYVSLWACRDNGNGDSLGKETCGGNAWVGEPVEFKKKWLRREPVKRLIAWMKENGITPKICVDGNIVPLDEVTEFHLAMNTA